MATPCAARLKLVQSIRDAVIGEHELFDGPFGVRRIVYTDYTASGRSLSFLEGFIRDEVLPFYANTHSEVSRTGQQTTRYREEARRIIHQSVGAADDVVVLFCGSGATACVNRIIDVLNLRLPAELDERYELASRIPPGERPVVFIGPYEHHSNELPWRESIAEIVVIDEDGDGLIDQHKLEAALERYAARPLKIGSFSAASNVTGIVSDTRAITKLLHAHGALSFWDYAAAGPYVDVAMSCETDESACKDAVFLSPHKFVGGPGTPGVLVAKRSLFKNKIPGVPGGGTVAYVNEKEHRYLTDTVHREEGGTPAIVESIRAGLVFQLKDAVGHDLIDALETSFIERAIDSLQQNPRIRILGNPTARRLSIVSFIVTCGERALHHNAVVAMLNDLFGIQARGGCSCAGPYGHRLLGIDIDRSHRYEEAITCGLEGLKPGWVRLGFNYFLDEETFRFVLDAVHWIADYGGEMLGEYDFDPHSGRWRHRDATPDAPQSLGDIDYSDGAFSFRRRGRGAQLPSPSVCFAAAAAALQRARAALPEEREPVSVPASFEPLRWFVLPHEARA